MRQEKLKCPKSVLLYCLTLHSGQPWAGAVQSFWNCSQGPVAAVQTFHLPPGRRGTWHVCSLEMKQSSGTLIFLVCYFASLLCSKKHTLMLSATFWQICESGECPCIHPRKGDYSPYMPFICALCMVFICYVKSFY